MVSESVFGNSLQPSVLTGSMIGEAYNSRLEYDPRLPVKAGEMKRRLEEIKADAIAVGDALREDFAAAFTEVQKQRQRVEQVKGFVSMSFSGNVELAKDPAAMRKARKEHADNDHGLTSELVKLERLERERDRLDRRMAKSRGTWRPVARVLDRLENYLRDCRGSIRDAPGATINKADTVASVQAKIEALQADLNEVEKSPWPSSDAKARATAEVDFIASHGGIKVERMLDSRDSLEWPHMSLTVAANVPGADGWVNPYDRKEISAEMALTAWLFRDTIVQRLHAEIDELADDDRALSADARTTKALQIKASILGQQRIIAGIIWRDGLHDQWPADIDPRAALGFDGPDVDGLW